MKISVFEDYFDDILNGRGLSQRSDRITISKEEYKKLLEIAERYESLAAEHKRIKSQNDVLLKELDDLKDDGRKFKELEEEKEKYLNSLLRARADLENYKKISERENEKYRSYAMEKILTKLIGHYEDLTRALNILNTLENAEHIKRGFEMLVNNFEKLLAEEGLRPMNCKGEKFDPYKHEAMMVEECNENLPDNIILEELDRGWYYKDKVLKPARVKVSKCNNSMNLKN
ncbi:MAG: nucleotide exchange factor GrpE [Promethearchaeota archaeon]|nr:MAG: nucleotide exchange factor GrpE [Candidatus Lokiarchaeota archaeon]